MQVDAAVLHITCALENTGLHHDSRASALLTLDVLQEHKRLKKSLQQAVSNGIITPLHDALRKTPDQLLKKDHLVSDKLRELLALCRNFQFDPDDFRYTTDTARLPFMEAFAQCKIESNVSSMAELYSSINTRTKPVINGQCHDLVTAIRVICDRRKVSSEVLQGVEGEAWLRYQHARLLEQSPDRQPGQFKAIANTIGHELPVQPDGVTAAYRLLLSELRPQIPSGLGSAVFLYLGLNVIHGFGDGNGRLSRFVLGWECESAGLPPIIVPLEFRLELACALNRVIFRNDLESLHAVLKQAHMTTNAWLRELGSVKHSGA